MDSVLFNRMTDAGVPRATIEIILETITDEERSRLKSVRDVAAEVKEILASRKATVDLEEEDEVPVLRPIRGNDE